MYQAESSLSSIAVAVDDGDGDDGWGAGEEEDMDLDLDDDEHEDGEQATPAHAGDGTSGKKSRKQRLEATRGAKGDFQF